MSPRRTRLTITHRQGRPQSHHIASIVQLKSHCICDPSLREPTKGCSRMLSTSPPCLAQSLSRFRPRLTAVSSASTLPTFSECMPVSLIFTCTRRLRRSCGDADSEQGDHYQADCPFEIVSLIDTKSQSCQLMSLCHQRSCFHSGSFV